MMLNDLYSQEAKSRWPKEYEISNKKLSSLTKAEQVELFQIGNRNIKQIALAFLSNQSAGSIEVQKLVREHYQWICNFWQPNKDSYIGLGRMYVEDPRFAQNYESQAVGCAEFMFKAMEIFAQEHLSN
ncbi:MAG: TipAS antibiotic-recognition domain-containing protein [Candidatus Nanopelagicus sp.]